MLLMTLSAHAQRGVSTFGVRGGVSFSNITARDYRTDFLTGYNVGVSYALMPSPAIPIYIEGAVEFQQKGSRDNGFLTESGSDTRLTIHAINIPVVVGCNVVADEHWTMQPFAGLYYSVALSGSVETDGGSFDPFALAMLTRLRDTEPQAVQLLHRSDVGVSVGMSALYERLLFGFSYSVSLLNIYTREFRDSGFNANLCTFSLNVGYNF